MCLKQVVLRTAHYLEGNIWHPAGSVVAIPEEHFDPAFHAEAPKVDAPAAKPDGSTSIAPESIPALFGSVHKRIAELEHEVIGRLERLEQSTVGVLDFSKLHERVQEIEAHPALSVPPLPSSEPAPAPAPPAEPPKEG